MTNITQTYRDDAYLKSSFYEQLVEHVFISEVLQEAWYGFGRTVEVLRSEVDASGYDIVFECNSILRHVQLKTSRARGSTKSQKANIALADKASGCIVWIVRDECDKTNRMSLSYLFFGGEPGQPLPALDQFRVARHTKPNANKLKAERPSIRVIPKGQFSVINTTTELVQQLFGLGEE